MIVIPEHKCLLISHLALKVVSKGPLGFKVEVTLVKVELSCATTTSGAQCVMILGVLLTPMWSVVNWDLLQQVI